VLRKQALVLGFLVGSAPAVALATPGFPAAIRSHLGLDYQPPCTLCHRSAQGGGPVVTQFGTALLDRGLRAGSDSSLTNALDQLVSDGVDSDADGIADVDELLAGSDPNSASPSASLSNAPAISHGCVGRIAPSGAVGWPALAGFATFVLLMRRPRRRTRSPNFQERRLP
jgi:hypothetical protein